MYGNRCLWDSVYVSDLVSMLFSVLLYVCLTNRYLIRMLMRREETYFNQSDKHIIWKLLIMSIVSIVVNTLTVQYHDGVSLLHVHIMMSFSKLRSWIFLSCQMLISMSKICETVYFDKTLNKTRSLKAMSIYSVNWQFFLIFDIFCPFDRKWLIQSTKYYHIRNQQVNFSQNRHLTCLF